MKFDLIAFVLPLIAVPSVFGRMRSRYVVLSVENSTNVTAGYYSSKSSNCTDYSDCNYNGVCTKEKTCRCNDGYITFPEDNESGCNYKQKNTLTAFLLQFFLGGFSGAGYFYLDVIPYGVGELFLFWGFFFCICIFACCLIASVKNGNDDNTCLSILVSLFGCLWIIGILVWWIYSLVTIANGSQLDGNGAPIPRL